MNKNTIIGDLILIFSLVPVVWMFNIFLMYFDVFNPIVLIGCVLVSAILILIHGKITDEN